MQKVDSDALGIVTKALGLSGQGSQITEFLDGQLNQTLDVGPIVRRGRTLAGSGGTFACAMENVHTDAESQITTVTPYGPIIGRIAPYPDPVPPEFDVWLIDAALRQTSGAGTLSAILDITHPFQGWGVNDSGVAVVGVASAVLAFWDALATEVIEFGILNQLGTLAKIGLRLPRASTLRFRSTSSLTATFQCALTIGLFPVSLGQDAVI